MERFSKAAFHVAFAFVAFLVAYQTIAERSIDWWLYDPASFGILQLAVVYAAFAGCVELMFRVERSPWRFASIRDALLLFRSATLTAGIFVLFTFIANRGLGLPRSTVLLVWFLHFGGLSAVRLLRRALYEGMLTSALVPSFWRKSAPQSSTETLLIVGGAQGADAFLREIDRSAAKPFNPIGVLTVSTADTGKEIRGVPVLGGLPDWDKVRADLRAANAPKAVLFLDEPTSVLSVDALGKLASEGVRLLRLPRIVELAENEVAGFRGLREVTIEELLSRPPVNLDLTAVQALVAGRRVLVTGAGGSIGSEVCRQAAALGCGHLTMIDHSEFALFKIDRELGDSHPTMSRKEILCNVRDWRRIEGWFKSEKPDIVFHAAALKHVPLVENHPGEGALTNVLGTCNVAEAASACGASDMVFISTDKAVDPSNVMGATKRLAESVVRKVGSRSSTRFSVVRFGNVLGSAGSVVPIFQEQISRGGPVTVTHADVERYFMTIPEAVQLVLHATAMSQTQVAEIPSVFVLEMGNPVKIYDLAKRMIELSGRIPGREVAIEIVGLRPGEKLTEDLVDETEVIIRRIQGVMEVSDGQLHPGLGRQDILVLVEAAQSGDAVVTRQLIFDMLDGVRAVTTPVGKEALP